MADQNQNQDSAEGGNNSAAIIFILPRFHPNLTGWVKALEEQGFEVYVLVLKVAPLEDHSVGTVLQIPSRLINVVRSKDPHAYEKFRTPAAITLARFIRNRSPVRIVIRADWGLLASVSTFVSLTCGYKPIWYSQRPAEEQDLSRTRRLAYRIITKTIITSWITPVRTRVDAGGLPLGRFRVPGKVWVPFFVPAYNTLTVAGER